MNRDSSAFSRLLGKAQPDPAGRRWLYLPYDPFSDAVGPLSREEPAERRRDDRKRWT